uniref:DUF4190 domain-containing protein n=1 Tax=Streptomyces sp. NBC_00049 TaxID=2903617 RepID=A0AAU2JHF1_9ACTN
MSSRSVVPAARPGDVPSGVLPSLRLRRAITWLSWCWAGSIPVFLTPLAIYKLGFTGAHKEFGPLFWTAAPIIAVVASVTGFVVAHVGRQQRARGRFVIMGVATALPILLFWVGVVLLAECPAGHRC